MTVVVVKVGGSLSQDPEKLRALCRRLNQLAKTQRIVVVPGGGEFADCVRALDKRFALSAAVAHHMAILGMDQYGLLLSDLIPNCQVVNSLEEVKNVSVGRVVVFLPSTFMFFDDGLPNSWEVTSDSIAAYIAGKLKAEQILLMKDVGGIYTDDPKKNPQAKLLEKLTVVELSKLKGKTCVDAYLPKLLETLQLDCYVLNGFHTENIEGVLGRQKTAGTVIWREFL